MTRRAILTPLAAALVGAGLGAAVVAGSALLLYTGAGLLTSIGFLASLALLALAAGVWAGAPGPLGPRRGRWIATTVVYAAAAVFAHAWLAAPPLQQIGFARALAVLFFLAQPGYLSGALLAGLAAREGGREAVAAAGLAGAAAGTFAGATLLVPNFDPAAVYFTAGAAAAVAGILYGAAGPAAGGSREVSMHDRVVIITGVGAPGQLGFALAKAFRTAGARLVLGDLSPRVEALAGELGGDSDVVGVVADLTTPEGADRLVTAARERFGRLDAVVNAAGGLSTIKSIAETELEDWEREHHRNATTAFVVSRAGLPLLRESRGAIVNFASPAALRAPARLGAYSAAKAGVAAFTHSLALEERAHGVRVNAIAPGMIDTEQNRASVGDPASVRWVTREQVAAVALFLASDAASGVSGEIVHVLGEGLE